MQEAKLKVIGGDFIRSSERRGHDEIHQQSREFMLDDELVERRCEIDSVRGVSRV